MPLRTCQPTPGFRCRCRDVVELLITTAKLGTKFFQRSATGEPGYHRSLAGKSGAELIPLLIRGGDGIKDVFDQATTASGESLARIDAVGDRIEGVFGTLRAWGAEALGFLIQQVDTLAVGIAATLNYIGALPQGLKAAQEAFDSTITAAVDMQMEEERAKADLESQRRNTATIDPEALQDNQAELDKAKKDAEDLEKNKQKLREDIAGKKTDRFYDSLDNETKTNFLEDRIAFQDQKIKENEPDSVAGLEAQKKKLELEEKLKGVRDDMAKDEERLAKESQKSAVEDAKDKLKDGEDALSKVKGGSATSIDSLRAVGGGFAGVRFTSFCEPARRRRSYRMSLRLRRPAIVREDGANMPCLKAGGV